MPHKTGIEAIGEIRDENPDARILILTSFAEDEKVYTAMKAGALGYLLKDVSSARLVEAVLAAARGESVLQPSVAAKVVARFAQLPDTTAAPRPQPLVVPLSERELSVLRLLADGASNREIATELFLAEGTVKNHVTNVLAKLGAQPNPYLLEEEAGWEPDLEHLKSKVFSGTRGIIVINPNNPTGAVYSRRTLEAIVELARQHSLVIFADEIYDKLVLDGEPSLSIASLAPDVPVVPYMSPGRTDSQLLRRRGIVTFGLLPFPILEEQIRTMHGNDEKVGVESFIWGTELLFRIVVEAAR